MIPSLGIAGFTVAEEEKKGKTRPRTRASIKGLEELGRAGGLGGLELNPARR